jgi:hypothetical protein
MRRLLLVVSLLAPLSAFAIAKGGTLYVAGKGVRLLKDAKPTAAKVLDLAQGDAVTWLGVSEKDRHFQEVEVRGKRGFVETQLLTPAKPLAEVTPGGRPIEAQSFANSGAAVKDGDMSGHQSYSKSQGPAAAQAEAELLYVEELNRTRGTPEAIEAKRKSLK